MISGPPQGAPVWLIRSRLRTCVSKVVGTRADNRLYHSQPIWETDPRSGLHWYAASRTCGAEVRTRLHSFRLVAWPTSWLAYWSIIAPSPCIQLTAAHSAYHYRR